MTNGIAAGIGIVVMGLIGADAFYNGLGASLFVARKGMALIEYLAFWR